MKSWVNIRLIVQLRLDIPKLTVKGKTITFNSIFSYFSKEENDFASCILCILNEPETLYHIVSVCPSYTLERQDILGRLYNN